MAGECTFCGEDGNRQLIRRSKQGHISGPLCSSICGRRWEVVGRDYVCLSSGSRFLYLERPINLKFVINPPSRSLHSPRVEAASITALILMRAGQYRKQEMVLNGCLIRSRPKQLLRWKIQIGSRPSMPRYLVPKSLAKLRKCGQQGRLGCSDPSNNLFKEAKFECISIAS